MTTKAFQGSCHCGEVKFSANIDLSKGTGKCNCSFCTKTRNWSTIIKPADFTLHSGKESLGSYSFNTKSSAHHFCKTCGVRTFTKGHLDVLGGDFYSISLMSLDNLDPGELMKNPIQYFDGRHDNWFEKPKDISYL